MRKNIEKIVGITLAIIIMGVWISNGIKNKQCPPSPNYKVEILDDLKSLSTKAEVNNQHELSNVFYTIETALSEGNENKLFECISIYWNESNDFTIDSIDNLTLTN